MTVAKIGKAPLTMPASDESIHCCPIGNSSNGAAIQTTPSSATRGRSPRSTGRWDPRSSESVSMMSGYPMPGLLPRREHV